MIELDTYGYSDHSIELSSDEEGNPGDEVIQSMETGKGFIAGCPFGCDETPSS